MDEVRVYNRALTDLEISTLAASGGYYSWVNATMPGLTNTLTTTTADPDNDGQLNLLEYAFVMNPLTNNASPFTITRSDDGSLNVIFPRRTGFSGVNYTVLKSDDLILWTPVTFGIFDETTTPIPGKAMEIVNDKILNQTQGGYFRLKVN